jgi:hypothetical protein
MADDALQQKLIDYIEDAHAIEQNVSRMLDSMISTTDDPEITEMLRHHKEETERHEQSILGQRSYWFLAQNSLGIHRHPLVYGRSHSEMEGALCRGFLPRGRRGGELCSERRGAIGSRCHRGSRGLGSAP